MTDEKNNTSGSSGKGFGGFGDLVSDVSKDIESATRESSNPTTPKFRATASSTSSTQHTTAQTEVPRVNKLPVSPQPPSGSSGAKWFWGIGIVMVVLISIGNSGKETSTSYTPSPAYSQPPTYAPAAIPTTEPTTPPASAYSPALPREDKPPVGTNISLSRDQIRYCLSEDIRLGAMKNAINQYADSDVDLFNAKVYDYNSRCGNFRYRRGSLESVRSEVEVNRLTLEAEGSARLVDLRGGSAQVRNAENKLLQPKSDNQLYQRDHKGPANIQWDNDRYGVPLVKENNIRQESEMLEKARQESKRLRDENMERTNAIAKAERMKMTAKLELERLEKEKQQNEKLSKKKLYKERPEGKKLEEERLKNEAEWLAREKESYRSRSF